MPLNPSAFSMLNTQGPERLAELFNPIRRDEQRNSLADLANQRELRSMQVQQGRQEMAAYPQQQASAQRLAKQKNIQELSFGLSQGLNPRHGIDKQTLVNQTLAEAKRRGLDNNDMEQLFAPLNSGKDDASLSAYYLNMANPQEAMKSQFEVFGREPKTETPADKLAREKFEYEKTKQPQENYNQPFLLGGVPNKAYQDYQRSLKPPVAPDLSGKPPSGYRYIKTGDLQAIPGGPADIKEQQKTSVQETGRENVSTVIAQLRDAYSQLKEGGGITDPSAGAMSNVGAGIASSGFGQVAGRMFGTQNQSKRNEILMTRPVLLQHIMKATGMSAKQMDSNAELKLWLSTATDPTLDIAANMQALDNIEKTYGIGGRGAGSTLANPHASEWRDL